MNPKYGWNWVVGGQWSYSDPNTTINFDNTNPIIPTYSNTYSVNNPAGVNVASISDANGNLLFYTNGAEIFDSNNNLVYDTVNNPAYLYGDPGAWHGVTIMPDLYTTDEYYIFTVGPLGYYSQFYAQGCTNLDDPRFSQPTVQGRQLYYSKIKIIGSTPVATQLNVLIGASSSTGATPSGCLQGKGYVTAITLVPANNPNDFWIVVRPAGNVSGGPAPWESYLVSNSTIGTAVTSPCSNFFDDAIRDGQIKVNAQYDKIAFAVGTVLSPTNIDVLTLYDFDNTTGQLTNETILFTGLVEYRVTDVTKSHNTLVSISNRTNPTTGLRQNQGFDIKGCEFSNTGDYLYISVGFESTSGYGNISPYQGILQIDITGLSLSTWVVGVANGIVTIPPSQALYYSIPNNPAGYGLGGLQRGPDGSIYFTEFNLIYRIRTLDIRMDNTSNFILEINQDYSTDTNYSIGFNLPNSPMGLLIGETPAVPEAIKLIPCCDASSPIVIPVYNSFPIIDGTNADDVYAIEGLSNYVNCWKAEYTLDPITYVGPPITISDVFSSAFKCEECQAAYAGCNTVYYNLIDCCTGLPVTDPNGDVYYFKYDIPILPAVGVFPTNYPPPIAINELINSSAVTIIEGCFTLNELRANNIPPYYLDWVINVSSVVTSVSCDVCVDCAKCFRLTNCVTNTSFVSDTPELLNYVGQSVTLVGYPNSYLVTIEYAGCGFGGLDVVIGTPYPGGCDVSDPCYVFTNCADPTDYFVTYRTDVATFLNYIVTVAEKPGKCFKITKGTNCRNYPAINFLDIFTLGSLQTSCADCRGCYKLTNCGSTNPTEVIYVSDPSYGQYLNQYIVLANKAECYLVEKDDECLGNSTNVPEVLTSFVSCVLCQYAINYGKNPIDPSTLIQPGPYKPKYGKKPKCGVTKPDCNNT